MITAHSEEEKFEVSFHPVIKSIAAFIAVLFHPLFIPIYICWFLVFVVRIFPELDNWNKTKFMISVFVNYTLLPLVTMLLGKGLGFVQSFYLKTQKDRIIPFIATGIFYFWIWYVFRNNKYPAVLVMFGLAVFLASSMGLLVNSYMKVSMHAISVGVVVMFMLLLGMQVTMNLGLFISIAILLSGLVCTARLITNDHIPIEIYAGLLVGITAQLIAYLFV